MKALTLRRYKKRSLSPENAPVIQPGTTVILKTSLGHPLEPLYFSHGHMQESSREFIACCYCQQLLSSVNCHVMTNLDACTQIWRLCKILQLSFEWSHQHHSSKNWIFACKWSSILECIKLHTLQRFDLERPSLGNYIILEPPQGSKLIFLIMCSRIDVVNPFSLLLHHALIMCRGHVGWEWMKIRWMLNELSIRAVIV